MPTSKRNLTITNVFVVIGIWLFLIVISPLLVPFLAYSYLKSKFENARLRRFLARNEGAKYFCYTSKKAGQKFARESILPHLDSDVRIIYMSQKGRVNLGDESIINTLIGMGAGGAKPGGYPCAAKVVRGELVSESLNTEFYRTIARNAGAETLMHHIQDFYKPIA